METFDSGDRLALAATPLARGACAGADGSVRPDEPPNPAPAAEPAVAALAAPNHED